MRCSAGGGGEGGRRSWRLKAIDFGFAIRFGPGDRFADAVGTLQYMAPEVLAHRALIYIWSAGVIIYELLAGRHPFPSDGTSIRAPSPTVRTCLMATLVLDPIWRRRHVSSGTREGHEQAIGRWRGAPDMRSYPWPYISRGAQSLVLMMLEDDPWKRPTARQVLGTCPAARARLASLICLCSVFAGTRFNS